MDSLENIQESEILIAGKDYSRTYREFVTMFLNDESCRKFLYQLRWNNNFICPKCKVPSTPWHQTHSQEHLQAYLEEYTFRFNRRLSKNRRLVFRRLLEQAVCTSPVRKKE